MTSRALGLWFLAPALIGVMLFFFLPVALTVMFSFTNMSTSTGILGGEYQLSLKDLRDPDTAGVSKATAATLSEAGYTITPETLAVFAKEYGDKRAAELEKAHGGESFSKRRDLENALKRLKKEPMRQVQDRKQAAELFAVTIIGERFETEAAFRAALTKTGVTPSDTEALVALAYTGWTWTNNNFKLLTELPSTLRYAMNTAFYVVCTLAFNVCFGLFLAISTFYLPQVIANTFRSIWFLPRILPPVMYVLMWTWFTWDTGLISIVTGWFGIEQINWMKHTPAHAWTAIILINGFVGASLGMILFSSAIKAIPKSMLYASEVDGANRWQQVRYIILPQLRWPILFTTCYQTLSLLTSFEYILLSTNGGPGRTTEVWALAAYHTALNNYGGNLEYGFGAAYALVLVVIGFIASVLYLRVFNFNALVAKPRIEQ